MKRDLKIITEISEATGFLALTVEKVVRLGELLTEFRSHPFLSDKFALKGGTAIQLFHLDAKRLSVDIDLNYTGAVEKSKMLKDRPQVDTALHRLCTAMGYTLHRVPAEHAGGKWRLGYQGVTGQPQVLEVDVNYLFRVPIWGTEQRQMVLPDMGIECSFPVIDTRELWAGKIAATLSRAEPRDLYDLACMPKELKISKDLRRTALLLASASRNDLRQADTSAINQLSSKEIQERLFPVVRSSEKLEADQLKANGLEIVEEILHFKKREQDYLDALLDQGDYRPEYLFPETDLQERVQKHPVLLWKAKNVREFKNKRQ